MHSCICMCACACAYVCMHACKRMLTYQLYHKGMHMHENIIYTYIHAYRFARAYDHARTCLHMHDVGPHSYTHMHRLQPRRSNEQTNSRDAYLQEVARLIKSCQYRTHTRHVHACIVQAHNTHISVGLKRYRNEAKVLYIQPCNHLTHETSNQGLFGS